MRKTYLYCAMALGLIVSSCKSDDLTPDGGSGVNSEMDQTFYVNLNILGDDVSGTRASSVNGSPSEDSDFATGTLSENTVNNAFFVFYDEDGNVVGDLVPIELKNGANNEYRSTVPIGVRKGEKKPTKVICYINPISPSTLQSPLNVIQTVARPDVKTTVNGENSFAMSNSVYYPEEGDGKLPQIAVDVPEAALFTSVDKANEALADPLESNVVKIHVERYATKLTFEAADPQAYQTATRVYDADGNFEVVPVSLTFVPEYWALNGEAKESYVIKSFRQESEDGAILADNYTYDGLQTRINPAVPGVYVKGEELDKIKGWDWNNPDFHRSYWGMSPAYFQASYPEVSSDLANIPDIKQTYLSYNSLAEEGFEAGKASEATQYFKETTVGRAALASNNPAAAVASVIYVGKYKLNVAGTAYEDAGFYSYLTGPVDAVDEDRPYVYFENQPNSVVSKVAGGESMLKRFLAQCTILYRQEKDENNETIYTRYVVSNPADVAALSSALEVAEITDDVKAYGAIDEEKAVKLQANARSLQFKNAAASSGIFILTGNGYKEIVADDVTPTNEQITLTGANYTLFRTVGCSYYYTKGHSYFNIPVRHLGWYRIGNDNNVEGAKFDWSKVRVGDFGMVRNHSYTISVTSISGLASGIGGDDIEIIPPANSLDYYVAYSVRILKWAVVPVQKVQL